jgi:hypothetical protein
MDMKELTICQKMLNRAKGEVNKSFRTRDLTDKLFAAKALGEVEGYLKSLKDNGLIESSEYAETFEAMTRLWTRL